MTDWREEILIEDLYKAYEDESITFEAFRDAVAERLSASQWAREEERIRELIEDLRNAETEKEYDDEMEYIYNAADDDLVWIGWG